MPQQKGKYPVSFALEIVKRMFPSERAMDEFYEDYQSVCLRLATGGGKPTESQVKLASLAKKFGYKEAAKKTGEKVEKVYAAVNKVSKYNYFAK